MSVHEVAASGFDAEAEAYERARPTYPADAVAWLTDGLGLEPARTAADVAAGTGKLTRLLVPSGVSLLAVEPVSGMRAFLRSTCPGVPVVAGTAELLPFADGSLDAITVAQAFHWFDAHAALREFHRVLRPGGRVGLVWNARDRNVSWVDTMWSIMDEVEKRGPSRDHEQRRERAFEDQPWFTPPTEAIFYHEQLLTHDEAVDRMRSVSHIAVLPPDEQEAVLARVRAALDADPATVGHERVALPYRVDAYWAERR
ncbi:MAG TPA: class I SAM-dependent methyltransferase [Acidimicrobiia bacterium]